MRATGAVAVGVATLLLMTLAAGRAGGATVVPQWLSDAAFYQRGLSRDVPLDRLYAVGTHNSYNCEADASTSISLETPKNQQFCLEDQLTQLSARTIEIDAHYIDLFPDATTEQDKTRVCHMSSSGATAILDACAPRWPLCNSIGIYDFGNHTGCPVVAPTLESYFDRVIDWLRKPENAHEVLVMYIDNYMEGRQSVLDDMLAAKFAPYALKTTQVNSPTQINGWPTLNEIRNDLGARIVIFDDGPTASSQYAFRQSIRRRISASVFDGAKSCNHPDYGGGTLPFQYVAGDRTQYIFQDQVEWDGTEGGAMLLTANKVKDAQECGFSPSLDGLDNELLAASLWTFADEQPAADGGLCAAVDRDAGYRWVALPCSIELPFACRRKTNRLSWDISSNGPYTSSSVTDNSDRCVSSSFEFRPPGNVDEMNLLRARMVVEGNVRRVWIAFDARAPRKCWGAYGADDTSLQCPPRAASSESSPVANLWEWVASRNLMVKGILLGLTLAVLLSCVCCLRRVFESPEQRRQRKANEEFEFVELYVS